jgi:hypothetical protein
LMHIWIRIRTQLKFKCGRTFKPQCSIRIRLKCGRTLNVGSGFA